MLIDGLPAYSTARISGMNWISGEANGGMTGPPGERYCRITWERDFREVRESGCPKGEFEDLMIWKFVTSQGQLQSSKSLRENRSNLSKSKLCSYIYPGRSGYLE